MKQLYELYGFDYRGYPWHVIGEQTGRGTQFVTLAGSTTPNWPGHPAEPAREHKPKILTPYALGNPDGGFAPVEEPRASLLREAFAQSDGPARQSFAGPPFERGQYWPPATDIPELRQGMIWVADSKPKAFALAPFQIGRVSAVLGHDNFELVVYATEEETGTNQPCRASGEIHLGPGALAKLSLKCHAKSALRRRIVTGYSAGFYLGQPQQFFFDTWADALKYLGDFSHGLPATEPELLGDEAKFYNLRFAKNAGSC